MYRTLQAILLFGGALLTAVAPARVNAQSFDTSGTASLNGQYLFRYVDFFNDTSGDLTESCSLTGIIAFDGSGNYTLSNTQLFDSAGLNGTGTCASLGGGTYGVQSNGIAQLDTPIFGGLPGTLFGTFSQPVVIASSTEDDYFDLFIAVQAPASAVSNGSFSGAFTVGTLDFLLDSSTSFLSLARQGYFTLNADGQGNIAAFTVNGSASNLSSGNTLTQNVAASTYALSGTAGGTVTFPGAYGDQTQIVGGTQALYVSADGNWFVGGSTTGADMIFGFRAPSGTSSNALLSGTYFVAGLEDYLSGTPNFLDAFYGSINANSGSLIWHERYDDVVDVETYDLTVETPVSIGANGSYYDGSIYTYLAGANGQAVMLIGSNQQFSLIVGVHAPSFAPPASGVWINPIGITDAANYTPITNAYTAGELVNLYGSFGVTSQVDKVLPIPTTLGGVQVFVNGLAAPVYAVSSGVISAWIPYEISGDYFATFQVVVNGSKSNTVTVYADNSSPGIYTLNESGIGPGAILHADYSVVNDGNPAVPGETVLLFMNGLGTVTPSVGDGVAASGTTLSYSNEYEAGDIYVELNDGVDPVAEANVLFAGLAPGLAGLYQVNFTVPTSGLANGDVYIAFDTLEALNEMATISLSGFPESGFAQPIASHRNSRPHRHAAHARDAKKRQRALPDSTRR
ncbi:MAG TPA: hypothetical protein VN924_23275 [Bryobacteraceae bacterium]|jgi:uncharacterized protein (TIGR03437 family)|nr:hypothetical protein [Bryobacteraceae bacterium]